MEQLWQQLGIPQAIRKALGSRRLRCNVERALFAMVANRACAPASKLYCCQQWLAEDVRIPDTSTLSLQHLYRAMDFLEANRNAIEEEVFRNTANLLQLDTELLFFDTTSLHWEIDQKDEQEVPGSTQPGGKQYQPLRRSKNGRGDAPQVVSGLAVTRDGFPVRHWVFPGNTVDVETVQQVQRDLDGWRLTRLIFVGDAGMVSEKNLQALAAAGGRYLVGQPLRQATELYEQVLSRPGRYRTVAQNLQVKQVTVGHGERRRRYTVYCNPEEAKRHRKQREQVLAELQAELASLAQKRCEAIKRHQQAATKESRTTGKVVTRKSKTEQAAARKAQATEQADGTAYSKRECVLRASGRYGRYLKTGENGLEIDRKKVAEAERHDGKFVVHANDDSLSGEDMALGYKQLQRVEQAWRTLQSGLRLRPVHHWVPHRIHAHVSITVLVLLLEGVAERACGDTWRNIRDDLKRIQRGQLLGDEHEVWQVTKPTPEASKRLKLMGIRAPEPILKLV